MSLDSCAPASVCACVCIFVLAIMKKIVEQPFISRRLCMISASPRSLHYDSCKICRPMRSWPWASLR